MNMNDLTKEDVDKMSDDEIAVWYQVIQRQAQVNGMRKELRDMIEIREAKKGPRIHVDSKVIE